MKRSEILTAFLNLVDESGKLLTIMQERLKKEDLLTQDLLHIIELDSYDSRNKAATMLSHNRKERRRCKDSVEELEVIVEWVDRHKNAVNDLKQTLGKLRKVEKYHENRSYRPRVLNTEMTKNETID